MKTRVLATDGNGDFHEEVWNKPEPDPNQIEVQALMTGICRSDIDMMNGKFSLLPLHMSGHEGLGRVTKVGDNILLKNQDRYEPVEVGDIVATRGEPAYSDYYNVRDGEFIIVPGAEARFIIEPIACGVNLLTQEETLLLSRSGAGKRCLIIGSGVLAWVAYSTLKHLGAVFDEITVIGHHNRSMWGELLTDKMTGKYDVVIDLGTHGEYLNGEHLANQALVIIGTGKHISQDLDTLIWKAVTIVFPSPRTSKFEHAMYYARNMIVSGYLKVDEFWSQAYDRDTEWQHAFADSNHRRPGYSRGVLVWSHK